MQPKIINFGTFSVGMRTVTVTDHSGFAHLQIKETTPGVLSGTLEGNAPDTGQILREFVDAVKFRAKLLGYHLDGGLFPAPRHLHDSAPSKRSLRGAAGPPRTPTVPAHHSINVGAKSRWKS